MPKRLTANELRRTFTGFFADRGHTIVPSASVIPHDPTVLFTGRGHGAVQAVLHRRRGAPYKRATSVQKCIRAGGKHNDLDDVGRTARHLGLLRDARQLQLRGLLQGRRHPLCVGVLHRGARARRPIGSGSPSTSATTRRRTSGPTRSGVPGRSHPAPRRATTSGRWATPARAVRRPRSSTTWADRLRRPRRARRRRRALRRDLEPRLHAVQPAGRRVDGRRCRSRASTPARVSSATSWCCRASTRCGRST